MQTKQAEDLERSISELKNRIENLPRGENQRLGRVPKELQEEAARLLRASKLPYAALARRIGVDGKSIRNWCDLHLVAATTKKQKLRRKKAVFKSLEITQDALRVENTRTYALDLRGGARVTGLSIEDIAKLMKIAGSL